MKFFRTKKEFLRAAAEGDNRNVESDMRHREEWVNTADKKTGETALHKAAANGHLDVVRTLLSAGAMNATSNAGETPLHKAAANGHLEIVKALLNVATPYALKERSSEKLTPVQMAIYYGHTEILKFFLESGKVDLCEKEKPVLYYAVECQKPDCVALLLEKGADPNVAQVTSERNFTEMHWELYSYSEVIKPPLWRAASIQNGGAIVSALLAAGARPNQPYKYGKDHTNFALHAAAARGNIDSASALITHGADINLKNSSGRTALHEAADGNHPAMVQLLLSHGARKDIQDTKGNLPVFYARQFARREIIDLLEGPQQPVVIKPMPAAVVIPPAPFAPVTPSPDTWQRIGEHEVAHIRTYPVLSHKLTTIFNFASRERMIIIENLQTRAEGIAQPESFDSLSDETLQQALKEFKAQGGKADEDSVFKYRMMKLRKTP